MGAQRCLKEEAVCLQEWRSRGLRGVNRAEPPVREHRRSGVTNEGANTQQAHHEKTATLRRTRCPRAKHRHCLAEGGGGEARTYGTIPHDLHALEKVFAKLRKAHPGTELRVCYEAGPTGFVLARRLAQLKIHCTVVAPSLIPSRSGDRVKTDRRDALKLARLHRAGELTAVHVPDASDEAMRDLCRARTDAVQDLRRGRARVSSILRAGL